MCWSTNLKSTMFRLFIFTCILFPHVRTIPADDVSWFSEVNLYWSQWCDFEGNDLKQVHVHKPTGQTCGPECANTTGCTHFVWTEEDAICWLKQGPITLDMATPTVPYRVCGMMKPKEVKLPRLKYLSPVSSMAKTGRSWDCCKPSCAWNGKAEVSQPVQSCQRDGHNPLDAKTTSACDGGSSYTCNSNQPWSIDQNFAFGFVEAHLNGQTERDLCCACFELIFSDGQVKNKRMVVQVTKVISDQTSGDRFDIQIPLQGGMGCLYQWGPPNDGWGEGYGGVSSKTECDQVVQEIRLGCFWRFNWFMDAVRPNVEYRRVVCPTELVERSKCRRLDEDPKI